MSIHADPLFLRAEIDRRLELFGVADALHPTPAPTRPASGLTQLVRRTLRALPGRTPARPMASRPRHP